MELRDRELLAGQADGAPETWYFPFTEDAGGTRAFAQWRDFEREIQTRRELGRPIRAVVIA